MRTPPQQPGAGLIARLLAEPQRFEFFQAVRLLVLWLGEHGVPQRRALERHLRFPNSLALGFPASQVESIARERLDGEPPRFHLTPTFMGLLGAHGALPSHFTERIAAWEASQPDAQLAAAPRAFLDMFSTRMLALFYGAWKKYRVEHMVGHPSDPTDRYLPLLLALAGFPPGGHEPLPGVSDQVLALYAGVLRQRPASGAVLGQVLSEVLRVPVALQEYAGHWDPLAPGERSALGGVNAVLGQAALLGARCWRPDLRVRVRIGPLDSGQFERFLPQCSGTTTLRTLLGLFAAPTLSYEVVLVLRRTEVRALRLGERSRRLGLDSYVVTAPATVDRDDMRYELRPMAALAPLAPATPHT